MIKAFTLLLLASLSFIQCDTTDSPESDNCPNAEVYVLKNLAGLDGCSWALAQGDKSYEPLNLADYITDPTEDQEVMLELTVRPDFASICQVGTIVEITCQK